MFPIEWIYPAPESVNGTHSESVSLRAHFLAVSSSHSTGHHQDQSSVPGQGIQHIVPMAFCWTMAPHDPSPNSRAWDLSCAIYYCWGVCWAAGQGHLSEMFLQSEENRVYSTQIPFCSVNVGSAKSKLILGNHILYILIPEKTSSCLLPNCAGCRARVGE